MLRRVEKTEENKRKACLLLRSCKVGSLSGLCCVKCKMYLGSTSFSGLLSHFPFPIPTALRCSTESEGLLPMSEMQMTDFKAFSFKLGGSNGAAACISCCPGSKARGPPSITRLEKGGLGLHQYHFPHSSLVLITSETYNKGMGLSGCGVHFWICVFNLCSRFLFQILCPPLLPHFLSDPRLSLPPCPQI